MSLPKPSQRVTASGPVPNVTFPASQQWGGPGNPDALRLGRAHPRSSTQIERESDSLTKPAQRMTASGSLPNATAQPHSKRRPRQTGLLPGSGGYHPRSSAHTQGGLQDRHQNATSHDEASLGPVSGKKVCHSGTRQRGKGLPSTTMTVRKTTVGGHTGYTHAQALVAYSGSPVPLWRCY